MKRLATLFMLSAAFCLAEEVTLTKSAVLKAERSITSLKAGTAVELVSRDEKLLTVRYGKLTGTIPVSSITGVAAAPVVVEPVKKEEPTPPAAPPRKAESTYGKAVEKARENAAKHDKNVARPVDEVLK